MYKFSIVLLLVSVATGCQQKSQKYDKNQISPKEREQLMNVIIRYVAKPPRRVLDSSKFDNRYNAYYEEQVKKHVLMAYHKSSSGEIFFLVSRVAPSLTEKYVATGGKMRLGSMAEPVEYEEVFRTWKMPQSDLKVRAMYLFDLMVKGEDLTPYYTATAGFNYIEFPDDNVYYDKGERTWKSKRYGSVEEMVYESRDYDSLMKK